MARIYRNLIEKKEKTIDDVPQHLKAEVLRLLAEKGLDGYGDPLV